MLFTISTTYLVLTLSSLALTIDYRLPRNVVPSNYDITVEPFFEGFFNFSGEVTITATVEENSTTIFLHSRNLDIQSLAVSKETGETIQSSWDLEPERHFLVITTPAVLVARNVIKITVKYMGVLNDNNTGFYKSSYKDKNGNVRWLASTQLAPTDARQVFPCFDEPEFKAVFQVKIKRGLDRNAVSNTRLHSSIVEGNKVMDTFKPTPKMSTYLLAFAVSDFKNVTKDNHEVYARPDYIDEGRAAYALNVSSRSLKVMETFTDIPYFTTSPYQMEKIAQIGIPNMWFTAMENWGLITYVEAALLFKEDTSTVNEKQTIAEIISHEYAHQCFGNLVSPSWWQYIWLNEGFARYFQYFAASLLEPDWRLTEQVVTSSVQYAMELDSADKTRPMSNDVQSPAEISTIFDFVSYDKAASVIRMMEHFLTAPVFQNGLRKYLKAKQYNVANEDDLWTHMQQAINESSTTVLPSPIAEIMKSWSLNPGYPVLNVTRNANNTVTVTQERFFLNQSHPKDSAQKWYIPINYASSDTPSFEDTKATVWLNNTETQKIIPGLTLGAGKWIVFNKNLTGYYRVNYDSSLWRELAKVLNSADFVKIPAVNRAQILDDAFNLARSGRLGYDILLSLMKYVERETDYIPLVSFFRGMQFLNRMVEAFDKDTFKLFASNLLQASYKKLGTNNTGTHIDRLNRVQVLTWLCDLDHKECKTEMKSLLEKMETTPIPPDMQMPVYCGGMIEGTMKEFNMLMGLLAKNDTEDLQAKRIITGLGRVRDKYMISLLLISSQFMTPAAKLLVINSAMSGSEVGFETTLDYLTVNFEGLQFPVGQKTGIIKYIASRATKEETMKKVEVFLKTLGSGSYASAAREAQANIESNRRWLETHKGSISLWLKNNKGNPGGSNHITVNILMVFGSILLSKIVLT